MISDANGESGHRSAANLLIKQHGDEAAIHAAMRVDELLEASDLDGYTV